MSEAMPAAPSQPFEGLYAFVRTHLLIVNNMIAGSCFAVGALDFLAPKLWLLPRIVYSCTATLAVAMLFAALVPSAAAKVQARVFGDSPGHAPLWRRGGWQFAFAWLCIVSIVGFASVAKASMGGLAASQLPAIHSLQVELLSLRSGVAEVNEGVAKANAKLDRIVDSVDPASAADRCADLECAVSGGASPEAVRKLFAKGAKLPGDPPNQAALMLAAATSQSAGRLDVVDQLLRNGLDRDMPLHARLVDPAALTKAGALNAKRVFDEADLAENPSARFAKEMHGKTELDRWNSVAGCLLRSSGGMTLIEFAALQGDRELFDRLTEKGAKPRPLACKWGSERRGGTARIDINKAGSISIRSEKG